MMNNQEIYNKVRDHLLAQNCKAMTGDSCTYRSHDHLQCAVGCLIKDKYYTPEFEGFGVPADSELRSDYYENTTSAYRLLRAALINSGVPLSAFGLLSRLQDIHDEKNPADWAEALKYRAIAEGLEP